ARLYSSMLRRFERQIEGQRLLLGHILDNSADGIVTVDAEDRIRTWNRGARHIFGYTEEEILGQHASILHAPGTDTAKDLAEIRRAVEEAGVLRAYSAERVTRKGKRIRTEISSTILRDDKGRYAGGASIIRDVTERDRIRDELTRKESLAAVGELAAAIAHEIKNPLAGIGGAVQVIGRSFAGDDPRAEVVSEIRRQVDRLDETIRDLLAFARPAVPRFGLIDFAEFTGRILRVLGEEPELKRHEVEVRIPPGLTVRADPQLLENVLINLLLNAGQAMGERSGRIVLQAGEDATHTRISVLDDGPGIPAPVLPNIFKPFFTTKHRGTGLGLTIVRKLVEGMGGRIEVETAEGRGSAFTAVLPREEP
ncbi:MAG: two-component system sensor histidine kinase NtrB, partial [Planctomycetota bacterium]